MNHIFANNKWMFNFGSSQMEIPSQMKLMLTRAVFMTVLLSTISGCSLLQAVGLLPKPPTPPPVPEIPLSEQPLAVTLTINVMENINPDADGRPSPVKTKIFLTEPSTEFAEFEFDDIFGLSSSDLEPSPLKTITLRPGISQTIELAGVKTQTQLVIACAFRNPYSTKWLSTDSLTVADYIDITANITSLAVIINSE